MLQDQPLLAVPEHPVSLVAPVALELQRYPAAPVDLVCSNRVPFHPAYT